MQFSVNPLNVFETEGLYFGCLLIFIMILTYILVYGNSLLNRHWRQSRGLERTSRARDRQVGWSTCVFVYLWGLMTVMNGKPLRAHFFLLCTLRMEVCMWQRCWHVWPFISLPCSSTLTPPFPFSFSPSCPPITPVIQFTWINICKRETHPKRSFSPSSWITSSSLLLALFIYHLLSLVHQPNFRRRPPALNPLLHFQYSFLFHTLFDILPFQDLCLPSKTLLFASYIKSTPLWQIMIS